MVDAVRFRLRSTLLAAAIAVVAGVAQAQTPPAAAPVPPVGQPEPPPATMAAARQLVVASGMARSFAPMVPQLMEQITPMLTRTRPELRTNLTEVLKQLQPEFVQKGEGMNDIAAKIYATQMSEDELKQAATFFDSDVGKKYVLVQPVMLDQLVVAMQSWTQTLSTFMMTRVHDEMKKRGQDF